MGRLLYFRRDVHEATQHLLPWYITGQIEPLDRLTVEDHLAGCRECREELAFEYRLRAVLHDLPPLADDLATKIATPSRDRRTWLSQPVKVAWFIAAQAAVILLCVGLFAYQHVPEPTYRALGEATPSRGNMLVMFAQGTSVQFKHDAARRAHAELLRGPTLAGAYVLIVAPGEREAALSTLRATTGVTLAEPIDSPAS